MNLMAVDMGERGGIRRRIEKTLREWDRGGERMAVGPSQTTLGERVRVRRIELGLSQHDVPGFSQSTISAYERGLRVPSASRVRALATALHVEISDLLPEDPSVIEPIPRSEAYQPVMEAMAVGRYLEAYGLAVTLSRRAHLAKDFISVHETDAMVQNIMRLAPDDIFVVEALDQLDMVTLESSAGMAYGKHLWDLSRLYNAEMLARSSPGDEEHGRLLNNRASLSMIIGDVSEARRCYDAILAQDHAVESRAVAARMGRAIAGYWLGTLDRDDMSAIIPHMADNPYLWQQYWWLLGHHAWREEKWDRLRTIRRASIRTFNPNWGIAIDEIFHGLDAALAWYDGQEGPVQRLRQDIADDATRLRVGYEGWADLIGDWIGLSLAMGGKEASQYRELLDCLRDAGMTGWATYWLGMIARVQAPS